MNLTASIFKSLLRRKLVTTVFITASLAAFATLGDGGKKLGKNNNLPFTLCSKTFSLRSGYNYKSNDLLTSPSQKQFILLNTTATYQKGNATYVLPLKKTVLLEKIKFNPAAQ